MYTYKVVITSFSNFSIVISHYGSVEKLNLVYKNSRIVPIISNSNMPNTVLNLIINYQTILYYRRQVSQLNVAVELGNVENDCLPQNMNSRLAEGGDNCLGVYLQTGLM